MVTNMELNISRVHHFVLISNCKNFPWGMPPDPPSLHLGYALCKEMVHSQNYFLVPPSPFKNAGSVTDIDTT